MSNPTYDWAAAEQYESVGLDPRAAKFVGVKNMMNFRRGYGGIMKAFFVLRFAGPTPTDYRKLPYKRVRRPIYPLDDLEDLGSGLTQSMTGLASFRCRVEARCRVRHQAIALTQNDVTPGRDLRFLFLLDEASIELSDEPVARQ